ESIIEATILKWVVEIGGEVEADEPVLEIATDKVDSEVPAPVDGILLETLFNEDDVVPVGAVIAILESDTPGDEASAAPVSNGQEKASEAKAAPVAESKAEVVATTPAVTAEVTGPLASRSESGRFYSPLVLNIARTEGVSMTELEVLAGSGSNGRVTKKDILGYLKGPRIQAEPKVPATSASSRPASSAAATAAPEGYHMVKQKSFHHSGNIEIQEMGRMRRMIAENMVYSKHVSAHVTSFVEADVTNLVLWRNRAKTEFLEKYGEKLTFTPLFVEAVAQALREHPLVNVSVDGNNLIVKKDINVGIAVALPTDNLIVPIIKNADRLNLSGLAASVNDLAVRARENKLKLEELEGGTYTVSNVGTFGNVMGTPVIMQPQVAILAVGAIRKKPAVIETEMGDIIGIRHMMFLSHSYDHRVVDGALGGRFVRRVADLLEAFDPNRVI
ncbi:MAG TPA: 2-oxo acid dehydrogenase subunit E2, partial [Bacteroidetes bacterium]|nr:2-oxo acid dehydrogenase subunit E2 [Bacteroidota bacterium]